VDVAHDFRGLQTILGSLADAPWSPSAGDAKQTFIDQYGSQVVPVAPTLAGDTWTGQVWTTLQSDLVRHDLTLTKTCTLTWQTATVASGLPVSIGI